MSDNKVVPFPGQHEPAGDGAEWTDLQWAAWYLAEVEVIIGGIKACDDNSNILKDIAMERASLAYEHVCDMLAETKQEHPLVNSHPAPGGLQ
ncbi:TPA: hypothetical protein P2M72_000459 [Aeromonas salmonicida]|uniref:hypothetical protein n=1 Tax=Aeromonas salmonicida TaxID=645 RepID=UPI00223EBEAC|nr:hypothetical protein [Aeromonas salmonicida]MDF8330599.1 hypothetical protein [Aeromonas salmonicida]HDO0920067.1 hypothetical protein [Aeromonas salmonicida]